MAFGEMANREGLYPNGYKAFQFSRLKNNSKLFIFNGGKILWKEILVLY